MRELLGSGSTNLFPCRGGCFGCKAWVRGHGPWSPTSLAFLHISPTAQFRASLTCSLSAHVWYMQHLPGVPDWLCWLHWWPALSLGEGLMERMVARSWLRLPALPKAHKPLRNHKWHITKLGFVPSASSAGQVPACPVLLRNGTSGCCWTSCIPTSQQPSHSTAGRQSRDVWRAAVEKGQPCRRKETCPSLLSFPWCLTMQKACSSRLLVLDLLIPPVFASSAGLWLNPPVALPHFESWPCSQRPVCERGKPWWEAQRMCCMQHHIYWKSSGNAHYGVCIFSVVFTQLTALLLDLPLVPRVCVCWGLVWPLLAESGLFSSLKGQKNWRVVAGEMSVHKWHGALHYVETGLPITQNSVFTLFWMSIIFWAGISYDCIHFKAPLCYQSNEKQSYS